MTRSGAIAIIRRGGPSQPPTLGWCGNPHRSRGMARLTNPLHPRLLARKSLHVKGGGDGARCAPGRPAPGGSAARFSGRPTGACGASARATGDVPPSAVHRSRRSSGGCGATITPRDHLGGLCDGFVVPRTSGMFIMSIAVEHSAACLRAFFLLHQEERPVVHRGPASSCAWPPRCKVDCVTQVT